MIDTQVNALNQFVSIANAAGLSQDFTVGKLDEPERMVIMYGQTVMYSQYVTAESVDVGVVHQRVATVVIEELNKRRGYDDVVLKAYLSLHINL